MIGIDIARIKRWYVKTYPTYSGTAYKIVVTSLTQTNIDTTHDLDGVDLSFTCKAYAVADGTVANTVNGVYNRKHYGGWDCYVPVVESADPSVGGAEQSGGGAE